MTSDPSLPSYSLGAPLSEEAHRQATHANVAHFNDPVHHIANTFDTEITSDADPLTDVTIADVVPRFHELSPQDRELVVTIVRRLLLSSHADAADLNVSPAHPEAQHRHSKLDPFNGD